MDQLQAGRIEFLFVYHYFKRLRMELVDTPAFKVRDISNHLHVSQLITTRFLHNLSMSGGERFDCSITPRSEKMALKLACHSVPSTKFLENIMNTIKEMTLSAWSFVVNPESRVISEFNYPSGNPMSIAEARERGLVVGESKTPNHVGDILLIVFVLLVPVFALGLSAYSALFC